MTMKSTKRRAPKQIRGQRNKNRNRPKAAARTRPQPRTVATVPAIPAIRVFFNPESGRFFASDQYVLVSEDGNSAQYQITGRMYDVTPDIATAVVKYGVTFSVENGASAATAPTTPREVLDTATGTDEDEDKDTASAK